MYIPLMAHVHIRDGVADWYWTADFGVQSSILPTCRLLVTQI